jgi:serine/threonine-protein kinase
LESGAWHELERVVERFERAWEQGSRPTLDEFLPADTTVRSALVIELAHAELEYRLRAGEPARAEDYLRKFPELRADRTAAMDFISAEYDIRSRQETTVTIAEYLERFPEYGTELQARLEPPSARTVSLPPAGQTSQPALETRAPLGEPSAGSGSNVPRVRLRAPRDEAELPLRTPAATLPGHAGRCSILGEIARGGMGAVLKGHDPELGRDLAVKILLDKYLDQPELERRFLVEAQVSGQLQHPGIVPVYDVGLLLDRRPYFTMKLVRGRTLSALLAERREPAQYLPRFLKIFEQVCQTLAYAHARGVIHRDLKPTNVMVGAFGEVQVMDWGLAKVLDTTEVAEVADSSAPAEAAAASVAGSVVGTPAYMAPEQARGEIDRLDERCDVFGLGAILCEILTGGPPYISPSRQLVFRQAEQGRLDDAFRRLDSCGADGELLRLAKSCLAVEVADRPRDAGIVARDVTTYLTGVQERLRAAEVERAAAQAKAEEAKAKAAAERRAKRLTLGLAVAVFLTAGIGGAAGLWIKKQRDDRTAETARVAKETEEGVESALQEALKLRDEARLRTHDPAQWYAKLAAALSAMERAERLLASGIATDELEERVGILRAELDADDQDRRLVDRLDVIRLKKSDMQLNGQFEFGRAASDYAKAFRDHGMDLDTMPAEKIAERIRKSAAKDLLVATLEEWANLTGSFEAGAKQLAIAGMADPSLWRVRFHAALRANNLKAIQELADTADVTTLQAPSLTFLGFYLSSHGDTKTSAALLRRARQQYPMDFWVNLYLGLCLCNAKPPHYPEAVRCLSVAAALRKKNEGALAYLGAGLIHAGELDQAVSVFEQAVRFEPDNARARTNLGIGLGEQGQFDKAIVELRRAIQLNPNLVEARIGLGVALARKGERLADKGLCQEAVASLKYAIRLDPGTWEAHSSLGAAYFAQKEWDKSIAAYRKAIRLKKERHNEDDALARGGLGNALAAKGQTQEAVKEYQEALRLQPDLAEVHYSLGHTYQELGELDKAIVEVMLAIRFAPGVAKFHFVLAASFAKKGALDDAIARFRQALALKEDYPEAHYNLGAVYARRGEFDKAIVAFRRAIELKPDYAMAHSGLGGALAQKGQVEKALESLNEAVRLDKNHAEAHNNLGTLWIRLGELDKSIAAYREATHLKPDLAIAHAGLGSSLLQKGKKLEALDAFKDAIRWSPDWADGHYNLAVGYRELGRLDDAIAEFKNAAWLMPKEAIYSYDLGVALAQKGALAEAAAAYRQAIATKPDYAEAHCNLGDVLRKQARFQESLASYKRGDELGRQQPKWPYPSERWVRDAQRLVELDRKVAPFLWGEAKPENDAEGIDFARLCVLKSYPRAGARLYKEVLESTDRLVAIAEAGHRYDAACAAALAGWGKGHDAAVRNKDELARWRKQALDWLRADLDWIGDRLKRDPKKDGAAVAKALQGWQRDPDLAGLRDPAPLKRLPEAEQQACRKLWADVEALLAKARGPE